MAEDGEEVLLYVYDLSNGFARLMSQGLLGKHIDGVWHTSVVVNGAEEVYFGQGIQRAVPGTTPHGQPLQMISLGRTYVPRELREEYLAGLAGSDFAPHTYDLFRHNCNTFSATYSEFLTGNSIPEHILALPAEVLATPFGQALQPQLGSLQAQLRAAHQPPATQSTPLPAPPASGAGPVAGDFADAIRGATASALGGGSPRPGRPGALGAARGAAVAGAAAVEAAGTQQTGGSAETSAAGRAAAAEQVPRGSVATAAAPAGAAGAAAAGASSSAAGPHAAGDGGAALARRAFEAAVRAEIARLMSSGAMTPNEAAVLAVRRAAASRA